MLLDRHLKRAMDIDDEKYQWYLKAMMYHLEEKGDKHEKDHSEEKSQLELKS